MDYIIYTDDYFIYLNPELEKTGYLAEDHNAHTIYAMLKAAIVAPVFEELIFRGVILEGFLKRYKPGYAILWSALLFGIMHLDPVQGSFAFIVGLLLGWVFWKTRSLFLCILLHAFNNSIAAINWDFELQSDETLREALTPLQFYTMYTIAVVIFVSSVYYIHRYYKKKVEPLYLT